MATGTPKAPPEAGSPDSTTPGRPKESGSRQQTQPRQNSQSGSPAFDKEVSRTADSDPIPTKPAGTK
jgi:hypothetical protein